MPLHRHRTLRVCEIEILEILSADRLHGEAPADKDMLRDRYNQYLIICKRLGLQPSADLSKSVLDRLHFDEFKNREYADWKRVRAAIEHENTVVNHRLTWFFTIQLVLIAAVGAVMKELRAAGRTDLGLIVGLLIASVIGAVLCVAIYTIIKDAHDQIDQLDRWWHRKWEPSIPEFSAEYSDKRNKAIQTSSYIHPPIQGKGIRRGWNIVLRPFRYFTLIFVPIICWLALAVVSLLLLKGEPLLRAVFLTGGIPLEPKSIREFSVRNTSKPMLSARTKPDGKNYILEIGVTSDSEKFRPIRSFVNNRLLGAEALDINNDGQSEILLYLDGKK